MFVTSEAERLRRRNEVRAFGPQIDNNPYQIVFLFVSGKSVMKSMEIERHRSSAVCSGSMNSGVFERTSLFRRYDPMVAEQYSGCQPLNVGVMGPLKTKFVIVLNALGISTIDAWKTITDRTVIRSFAKAIPSYML
ncbi:Hypothetical protein PHPALM_14842 [Phytophthora palmivora]|uniref:Uncharacterized protein n=1 Tax=Phytophthora palmivora TaxID=4796 RepID=A0A2P4XTN8_9STRA|nr:Hypothetical protein PHPALM_14842 [Phytophthora palmivora]